MVAAKFLINHPLLFLSSITLTSSLTLFVRERPASDHHLSLLAHISWMDLKSQTVFTIEPISNDTAEAKNKNNAAGQIFKVALFMLRRRPKKSKASVDMGPDKGRMWRRLLGSVRPLHIHDNEESSPAVTVEPVTPSKSKDDFEDSLAMPLPSPSRLSSSFSPTSRSSSFNTSRYTSAASLQELDDISNEDNEDQHSTREDGGDEMIDAKAEEFIAQFYEQMRRQRYDIY